MLPAHGAVEVLLGTSGAYTALRAELVAEDGRRVALELPTTHFDLRPVRFEVGPQWAGVVVRLHLIDDDRKAALFADDLWRVP